MHKKPQVTVELFGLPRQRAGQTKVVVDAATVAEALRALIVACPQLAGLTDEAGRVGPHFLVSIDGCEFIGNLQRELQSGERLLVMSADAGG